MAERIKRRPEDLRDQMTQAIAGINAYVAGGGVWPDSAPTVAALTAQRDALAASITAADASDAARRVDAQTKAAERDTGLPMMRSVDAALTLIYGSGAAEKANFGIPPEGSPIDPLHKLIEIVLRDGPVPGSLFFDWESIEGASYEVQWSTDSNFATLVGSAASASASDYVISGLAAGTQYWTRVRPLRGGQSAEWSDPATRVAPV